VGLRRETPMTTATETPTGTLTTENEKYALYSTGELWTKGEYAFLCGYCSCPENFETAIDAHEEEMACLLADAREEFGF
jgi:hypothetical protein